MPTEIRELPADDAVNSPKHYLCPVPLEYVYRDQEGNLYIDAISVIEAWQWQRSGYIFNVLKYLLRGGYKVGESLLKDLGKSRYYLSKEIKQQEKIDGNN